VALPAATNASAPPPSAPGTQKAAAAPNPLNAAASEAPPASRFGLWDVAAEVFRLSEKMSAVTAVDRRTQALATYLAQIRARLVDQMRALSARGDALMAQADSADGATLVTLRAQLDGDTAGDGEGGAISMDTSDLSVSGSTFTGDEGWGGRNFATYGADAQGYAKALAHEQQIMRDCFAGDLRPVKIERFTRYTLADHDHREYKWPWCGRYSVPFGLLTAWHLQQLRSATPLAGTVLAYTTSLEAQGIEVDDLDGMGVTAPATLRHWVGYAAVGFR